MATWNKKAANAPFVPDSVRCHRIAAPGDDSDSSTGASDATWEWPPSPVLVVPLGTLGLPRPLQMWDTERFIKNSRQFPSMSDRSKVECYEDSFTDCVFAVKRFPGTALSEQDAESCMENPWMELSIGLWLGQLGPISHQFTCKYYGAFVDDSGDALLAMELLRGGDLFDYAASLSTPGPDREAVIMPIVKSLFATVSALHDIGVTHNDISLENFMFRGSPGNSDLVLIDFGRALIGRLATTESGLRGKLSYRAPEMFKCSCYDAFAADLFALGVVVYTLAIGSYPWVSTVPGQCKLYDYIKSHGLQKFMHKRVVPKTNRRTVVDCMSEELQCLVQTLLSDEPQHRFKAFALLERFVC